tara:strand:+ start:99 stop:266 length:168 start_codon:yes stop_codon:yes gene_type:complete
MDNNNDYTAMGFENRSEYLKNLASEYGDEVYDIADLFGPSEDFDGLVSACEDLIY